MRLQTAQSDKSSGADILASALSAMQAKNHVDLMEALDLIDFDTAGSVSGSKFYYLKHAAALLEMALVNMALQVGPCSLQSKATFFRV